MSKYLPNWVATGAALVVVMGCVVIPDTFQAHIVVDIRHIQEQAEQALDYIEGKTDELPELSAAPPEDVSLLDSFRHALAPIGVAYAQKEDSPRAQQILKAMRDRHSQLESIKQTGAVGENNRGFVELVYPDKITDAERLNEVQRVIAAENEDRKAFYQEIARINQDKDLKVAVVEGIYAQKRLERARAGEVFQLPPAGETYDTFMATAKGKAIEGASPGAWVVIK
ncbi:MAG: DUF1318 domain-containing protein [Candidatus Hydrogenedentales bacterium]